MGCGGGGFGEAGGVGAGAGGTSVGGGAVVRRVAGAARAFGAGSRPTLGEMLSALLTSMTEVGFHLPMGELLETEYMNVAAVTGRHIMILAVPVE